MISDLVVIGAGGFGREALDVVEAANSVSPQFRVLGVIDDAPAPQSVARLAARAVPLLGSLDEWLATGTDALFIIGIGSTAVRRRLDEQLIGAGYESATAIHPSATLGSRFSVGRGSVICAGVNISTNIALGRHVHVNPSATIGHDAILEDYVSINPAAVISGDVTIRSGALVGAGAVVLQGRTVGRNATVGASACVVADVEDDSVVKGVPAR